MQKLFLTFFTCLSLTTYSQSFVIDSSRYSGAVGAAVSAYHLSMDKESALYNGPEHIGYDPKMIGSAYFGSNDWQTGSVYYDGILYRNVPMKYDEVLDKVVVQHFNIIFKLELFSNKVKWFDIAGHTFINIHSDSASTVKPGFYDLLASGNVTVLAKRTKIIAEFIEGNEVKRRIDEKDLYYAVKGNTYYTLSNKRSLLKVLNDRRKEVQQYLRKNKIKFKRKSEYAIVKAVEYYNQSAH